MTNRIELDDARIEAFERRLLTSSSSRVRAPELWNALAQVFPHRAPGPAERHLLLDVLAALEARECIRLPSEHGKRWDRSIEPAVPSSIDLVRERSESSSVSWKTFPWHSRLDWIPQCRSLSAQQLRFLRKVHQGLVNEQFREPAPLKYRSLQLTGDEKLLASLSGTSLFDSGRLTLDMLGCLPDALPLAWEAVGDGDRMVIFENAGPFAVARRVLAELPARPYDLVAYGGGRSILAALGHIETMDRNVRSIHYVGDLDGTGLEIGRSVQARARDLGLPEVRPASELHRQMLSAAESFGHPRGWPAPESRSERWRSNVLDVLAPDVRAPIERILRTGNRIPEEVLGPDELRSAWGH